MGGRQVALLRQAMGVLESCPGHAQRFGGPGHPAGKRGFAAADRFANRGGRVIRRFDRSSPDQVT